jgi:hypothetical protein
MTPLRFESKHILPITLFLCVLAALWLMLSPAAWERRAQTQAVYHARLSARQELEHNHKLERYRLELEGDRTRLETEGRRLGYGRHGEEPYPLTEEEIRAKRDRLSPPDEAGLVERWGETALQALVPMLLCMAGGAACILFFADLRIDPH